MPCFTAGTLIQTRWGKVPIEELKVGDLIRTSDNGDLPLRWIGQRVISAYMITQNPKLKPVRIMAGALGNGLPKRDLIVSRQHRMLIKSKISHRMLNHREVFISAIKLTGLPGIFVDNEIFETEYFHLLFDQHQIIYAEDAATESLLTGAEALKSLTPAHREEIATIFPDIAEFNFHPKPARYIPDGKLQKKLIFRHHKNNKPLV